MATATTTTIEEQQQITKYFSIKSNQQKTEPISRHNAELVMLARSINRSKLSCWRRKTTLNCIERNETTFSSLFIFCTATKKQELSLFMIFPVFFFSFFWDLVHLSNNNLSKLRGRHFFTG